MFPAKFQDKGMKPFDWTLRYSGSYCISGRQKGSNQVSLYVLKQEENSFCSGSLSQAFGQLWSSIKMMARRRRGNQGKCTTNFLFVSFFFLVQLRTASRLLNHAEHPSMQGHRLAVLKTNHSYAKNTKGVFLTWPDVLVIWQNQTRLCLTNLKKLTKI